VRLSILPALAPALLVLAFAQPPAPDLPAKSRAMRRLEFLVGTWEGRGWIRMGPERFEFMGRETVEAKIGGLALVIEGIHRSPAPEGGERIVHEALGVLTFDTKADAYRFVSHLADGRSGEYTARLVSERTLEWTLPDTPIGTMRYTIRVDEGTWRESGAISKEGAAWTPFFEMILTRIEGDLAK